MINIYTGLVVPQSGIGMCLNANNYQYSKAQNFMLRGDSVNGIVSVNACFYLPNTSFTTGVNVLLGTIAEPLCRPNSVISFPIPEILIANLYHDASGVAFVGTQEITKGVVTISGQNIYVYVQNVNARATLAGVDQVIIPVVTTFTNLIEEVILP